MVLSSRYSLALLALFAATSSTTTSVNASLILPQMISKAVAAAAVTRVNTGRRLDTDTDLDETAVVDFSDAEFATSATADTSTVSCMDWIPTDPSTPPTAYAHCYDGTYTYTLGPASRPVRCSPRYFNLFEYNYQSIVNSNRDGATQDEWSVCAEWYNLHAGLRTAYPDADLREKAYPITRIGNGGTFDLPVCTGDCDADEECQPGLYCLIRSLNSAGTVVGCEGLADERVDYCIPLRYRPSENWKRDKYDQELEEGIQKLQGGAVQYVTPTKQEEEAEKEVPEEEETTTIPEVTTQEQAQPVEAVEQEEEAQEVTADADDAAQEENTQEIAAETETEAEAEAAETVENTASSEKPVQDDSEQDNTATKPSDEASEKGDTSNVYSDSVLEVTDEGLLTVSSSTNNGPKKQFDEEKEPDLEPEATLNNRPSPKSIPVEVYLPPFFVAVDVPMASSRRALQSGDNAAASIDEDNLRLVLQDALYDAILPADERLWGVSLKTQKVDSLPIVADGLKREFFAVNGDAIFLVQLVDEDKLVNAKTADPPLPKEAQLRDKMTEGLQMEPLMASFATIKDEKAALRTAKNVGVTFMDGTPISGSSTFTSIATESETTREKAEKATGGGSSITYAMKEWWQGDWNPFSSSANTANDHESFFTPLTIGLMAGLAGFIVLIVGSVAIYSHHKNKMDAWKGGDKARTYAKDLDESGGDDDQSRSNNTEALSPMSPVVTRSAKEEAKKKQMDDYFKSLENVESQPEPSVSYDYEATSNNGDSVLDGMSEWSFSGIAGKDRSASSDLNDSTATTTKADMALSSMGKRMRKVLSQSVLGTHAEDEVGEDMNRVETESAVSEAESDFRLGSVLGDNMSEVCPSEYGADNNSTIDNSQTNKTADFSTLWKSPNKNDKNGNDFDEALETVEEDSSVKNLEDEVLGVSLKESKEAYQQYQGESGFLNDSQQTPLYQVSLDESIHSRNSEEEDEAMLFHLRPGTGTTQEGDEESADSSSAPSSSPEATRSHPGSIIASILGDFDDLNDTGRDSVGFDNTVNDTVALDMKGLGETFVDNDVSNADTTGLGDTFADYDMSNADTTGDSDMLNSVAEAILIAKKGANMLPAACDDEEEDDNDDENLLQVDMPQAYKENQEGADDDTECANSLYDI